MKAEQLKRPVLLRVRPAIPTQPQVGYSDAPRSVSCTTARSAANGFALAHTTRMLCPVTSMHYMIAAHT